jgi:hypothetical protein
MEVNMSKALKWTLGIFAALILVAVVVGAGFLVVSHWGSTRWMMSERSFSPWGGEGVRPWKDAPQFDKPMHPGWKLPMAPGAAERRSWFPLLRFGGFFPLGLICGFLFWAAVAFFAVYGVIALIRGGKNGKKQAASNMPAAAPATPAAFAAAEEVPAEASALEAAACSNCGHGVQEDWSLCPYCGQKLK